MAVSSAVAARIRERHVGHGRFAGQQHDDREHRLVQRPRAPLGGCAVHGQRFRGGDAARFQRLHVEPGGDRGGVHAERRLVDGCADLSDALDVSPEADALPLLSLRFCLASASTTTRR